MRHLMFLFILLLVSLPGLISPAPVHAQGGDQAWLMGQINSLRGGLGLHSYVWNNQLAAAAQQQSEYLAATGNFAHEHDGSTPQSRAAAQGYNGRFVSENIYGGPIAQAGDAWNFWINSPVHYAGIAHTRNNEIGVGVASGTYGNAYTLVFGYRSDVNAPPAPTSSGGGNTGENSGGNGGGVVQPTRAYVAPTKTFTPSPTIPTITPTLTWTPTNTITPSYTPSPLSATSTAIKLPTAEVVAMLPTAIPLMQPTASIAIPPTNAPQASLLGTAGTPNDPAAKNSSFLLWILSGLAILSIGFIFMGVGVYHIRK